MQILLQFDIFFDDFLEFFKVGVEIIGLQKVQPKKMRHLWMISSGTDEVRAKREPSLCNESVKRHVWFFSDTAATQKTRYASVRNPI